MPQRRPQTEEQQTGTAVGAPDAEGGAVRRTAGAMRPRHSAVSGLSIASLMGAATVAGSVQPDKDEAGPEAEAVAEADPESEAKIGRHRDEIVRGILNERPRFVVAFESMRVSGNTITVEVPSSTLCEEILRSKTEILLFVARTAEITGPLDLQVRVNEHVKSSRPIKLEDRIRYMTEKNAALLELKKALDMEYE